VGRVLEIMIRSSYEINNLKSYDDYKKKPCAKAIIYSRSNLKNYIEQISRNF